MQTILINAYCICRELQGLVVQAYVQWIIQDFATAYRKLDFSDADDPMRLVNLQLKEQAEAAIKDKVATMGVHEVLSDKQPIVEELTARLREVAEGEGGSDRGPRPAHRHGADQGGGRQLGAAVGEPAEAVPVRAGPHRPAGRARRRGGDLRSGAGRRRGRRRRSSSRTSGSWPSCGPATTRRPSTGRRPRRSGGPSATRRTPAPAGRDAERDDPARAGAGAGARRARSSRSAGCGWSGSTRCAGSSSTASWRWPGPGPSRPTPRACSTSNASTCGHRSTTISRRRPSRPS